eukprot:3568221-Pyramimonas_sp.AAC.1
MSGGRGAGQARHRGQFLVHGDGPLCGRCGQPTAAAPLRARFRLESACPGGARSRTGASSILHRIDGFATNFWFMATALS